MPDTLETRLVEETRRFVRDPRNVNIDPEGGTITLSAIFDWFEEDFVKWPARSGLARDPTLIDYIEPHLDAPQGEALARCGKCRGEFFEYDWTLNDQARLKGGNDREP